MDSPVRSLWIHSVTHPHTPLPPEPRGEKAEFKIGDHVVFQGPKGLCHAEVIKSPAAMVM